MALRRFTYQLWKRHAFNMDLFRVRSAQKKRLVACDGEYPILSRDGNLDELTKLPTGFRSLTEAKLTTAKTISIIDLFCSWSVYINPKFSSCAHFLSF